MKIVVGAAFVAACLMSVPAEVVADSLASQFPLGASFEGTVRVARADVPLPPGRWSVTAYDEQRNNIGATIGYLTLGNIVGNKFYGYVTIDTNVDMGRSGWTSSDMCSRKDLYFLKSDADYPMEQACWGVNHMAMKKTSTYNPMIGKSIGKHLGDINQEIPSVMIYSFYRFANENKFISYSILYNPEIYGISTPRTEWADSPWHRDVVQSDAQRKAFLEKVKKENEKYYYDLKPQFR